MQQVIFETGLGRRWQEVRQRVDAACRAVDRDPSEVAILPVTKTFSPEIIRTAVALGLRRFGENKVQEIRSKFEPLADCAIDWVGSLGAVGSDASASVLTSVLTSSARTSSAEPLTSVTDSEISSPV